MTIRHKIVRNKHGGYWGQATDVARAISNKAMEHLMAPLEAEEHALAEKIYAEVLKKCSLTPKQIETMVKHRLTELTQNITIKVQDKSGNELDCQTHNETGNELYVDSPRYNPMQVVCDESYGKMIAIETRRSALQLQLNDMVAALTDQINGRSTKEIFAEWPEATDIVAGVMQIDLHRPPMIKPLEQLLARYLPALPAPK